MESHEAIKSTPPVGLAIRPFAISDIPRLVEIGNSYFPEAPVSVEERERRERIRDPKLPFLQLVAELDNRIVGSGSCGRGWAGAVKFNLHVSVAKEYTRRGIGTALAQHLESWAREQKQTQLRSNCREDMIASVHFLHGRDFREIGKRFESALDIEHFNESRFTDAFDRAAAAGISFNTFDQESSPEAMQRLYELALTLFREIPLPGGDVLFDPFDDWKDETFDHPNASPTNTVVAKRNGAYVGYSSIWTPNQGAAFTIMTGVDPAVRGHGVALALKLLTIRIARAKGYSEIRTMNDTANPPILKLNEKMGYHRLPAQLIWEKQLDEQ